MGLRLEGMQKMGYVWARVDSPTLSTNSCTWHDVSVVGLRDDVPVPFVGFPRKNAKMGSRIAVVKKESMMNSKKGSTGLEWALNGD